MNLKNTALGIELGSTRIKAVLIDENHIPVASGAHEWENQLADYLYSRVFADASSSTLMAQPEDIEGFNAFLNRYKATFPAEIAAVEGLR